MVKYREIIRQRAMGVSVRLIGIDAPESKDPDEGSTPKKAEWRRCS